MHRCTDALGYMHSVHNVSQLTHVCTTPDNDHEGGCAQADLFAPSAGGWLCTSRSRLRHKLVARQLWTQSAKWPWCCIQITCVHLVDRSVVKPGQQARHTIAGSCSSSSTIASSCRSSSGCSGRVVVVVVAVVVRGG